VVIVGAGFAGMYMLHKLRTLGFSARVIEAAGDVGGTWYWNRYPGARCDITTADYAYGFDPELERAWTWSEKYATQPEILRYARFVADRYDLRRDIDFDTRVDQAHWDEAAARWQVHTSRGERLTPRFYVMATGCLSAPKEPDIPGAARFRGPTYSTSRWPHGGVDFTGLRVAVIGTGSSGIQCIPLIAGQAAQLTVFQRTANYSIPARNGEISAWRRELLAKDRAAYRQAAKVSRAGVPMPENKVYGRYAPPELRAQRLDEGWASGELIAAISIFADQGLFEDSNELVCAYVRDRIRGIVKDPATAEALCPHDHPFGTKRPCLDSGYYETFNRPNVRLVDLKKTPIRTITEAGVTIDDGQGGESLDFDAIVYATGFDAMTGALVALDIAGRDGQTLKTAWADGTRNYLGLMLNGFPNLFMITGPGSPSVLSNMMVSIEQHVDWIGDCLAQLRRQGAESIEPTAAAEAGWMQHCDDCAAITLHPRANSWYVGANVPGKHRGLMPYIGGVDAYRKACDEVAERGYLGFELRGADLPGGRIVNDGVVRRLQPDVRMVLDMMAVLNLPTFDSLPVDAARSLLAQLSSQRPPGPPVGEIRDGTLPGAAGDLAWRLYRPATPGPHPVVLYFHGGGWVLGSHDSDDPMLRDLCRRSGALVVSVDYRHAPEARFPAAADDALAAARWVGANAAALGGIPGRLALAGWSAGANLAAVTCRRVRDEGGPAIRGQLLLTPVTDCGMDTASYRDNAENYVLTATLMRWFWDHYCDPAERADPRASPLRAADLSRLPPALVVTCEFDPLRDEGQAYAEALSRAGVPVQTLRARGHTHTSPTMVDVVVSGEPVRARMAQALRDFFAPEVP
jgi:cation diffusion facilitator CzcD-associated flavoprotein CzcO/acetyl esterase/lipase